MMYCLTLEYQSSIFQISLCDMMLSVCMCVHTVSAFSSHTCSQVNPHPRQERLQGMSGACTCSSDRWVGSPPHPNTLCPIPDRLLATAAMVHTHTCWKTDPTISHCYRAVIGYTEKVRGQACAVAGMLQPRLPKREPSMLRVEKRNAVDDISG